MFYNAVRHQPHDHVNYLWILFFTFNFVEQRCGDPCCKILEIESFAKYITYAFLAQLHDTWSRQYPGTTREVKCVKQVSDHEGCMQYVVYTTV